MPAVVDGRILGHEAVGTVVAVGSAVNSLAEGDRVLVAGDHILRALRLLQAGACRATAWPPAASDGYSGT